MDRHESKSWPVNKGDGLGRFDSMISGRSLQRIIERRFSNSVVWIEAYGCGNLGVFLRTSIEFCSFNNGVEPTPKDEDTTDNPVINMANVTSNHRPPAPVRIIPVQDSCWSVRGKFQPTLVADNKQRSAIGRHRASRKGRLSPAFDSSQR